MARVDSLLQIVVQQKADELRLGTNTAPRVFRGGAQQRFAMPETSEETLRELLGPLLAGDREDSLRREGKVVFPHTTATGDLFEVRMSARVAAADAPAGAAGFDVIFRLRGQIKQPPKPQQPEGQRAPEPVSPALSAPPRVESLSSAPAAAASPPLMPLCGNLSTPTLGPRLADLLSQAAALSASDLHVADGERPCCRVDGVLRLLPGTMPAEAAELLHECLVPAVTARLSAGASADFAAEVEGVGRCRVNLYRSAQGLAAAIRLLPATVPTLASLQLPPLLQDLTDLPHGLVIVCGPTGSGKSSTLSALAQEALRRRPLLLISLEDPVEYRLRPGKTGGQVRQREVGIHVRDMATGLRDALREDPDILLIGEMRDPETIALALTAAETGRLVLATLHSRTATSSIERIVDSYPPERQDQIRVQLADALRAVISQRLLPRSGGAGRVPAVEVLRGNNAVGSLIRERKTHQLPSAMQTGQKEGMVTIERSLSDLVLSGQITQEAAEAVTEDRASLRSYLQR